MLDLLQTRTDAPQWHVHCTIYCYKLDGTTDRLLEVPEPAALCHVGSANNEIDLVAFYSEHVKQCGKNHEPWMFVLPKVPLSWDAWLQARNAWSRIWDDSELRAALANEYMEELTGQSIFRLPKGRR